MAAMSLSKARGELGAIVNRVSLRGERVVLNRNGKSVAAVVSIEDLELIRQLEDAADLKAARAARAEVARHGAVSWKKLKSASR